MKFLVEAKKEVNRRIGDRIFNNKAGETLELSAAGVEVALHPMMDDSYKLIREIPETDDEKERAEAAQAKVAKEQKAAADEFFNSLVKKNKDDLIAEAARRGVINHDSMKKEELARAITNMEFAKGDK